MAIAGFPIIGSTTVWSEWNNFGASAWNMWFMAPYGSWLYAGFVKSNTPYFRRLNIGSEDGDYTISSWDFAEDIVNSPETVFTNEQNGGYPNGSMGMGCIRGTTPILYLAGRDITAPLINDAKICKFLVDDGFEQDGLSFIPQYSGTVLTVNQICGIEVDPGTSIYLVTNNNLAQEFRLHRYAEVWDDAGHDAAVSHNLSTTYLENNSAARIRGIALDVDGNVLVFANTGLSSTECKVFKFHKTTLDFMGATTWIPNISTSTWAYLVKHGEVFLHFQGLDSGSSLDWRTAVYYDRATGIPNADKSNLIIAENLTPFGDDDPIELSYHARDSFNMPVIGANTKFYIKAEDGSDPSTWTDRVGAIMDEVTDDYFDADGVPLATSAIAPTDGDGVATAYYKPMRSGTGTERDLIAVKCPSDN